MVIATVSNEKALQVSPHPNPGSGQLAGKERRFHQNCTLKIQDH
jgi:hypothetical protein